MTPVQDMHRLPRFRMNLNEALVREGAHVYLGANRNRPDGRVLQKTLQAMGCKVTNRMRLAAV